MRKEYRKVKKDATRRPDTVAETALPTSVLPGDPRYEDLALRRRNERFEHRPRRFQIVRTTEQVVTAVNDALRAGDRIAVRSGGHSMENSVGEARGGTVIDMCAMNAVYFDPERDAFVIEAGATLGDVYRQLYLNWGVTIPGGWGHTVCAGGHIQGGGYGGLSRRHGSTVDHLLAVEVVVVDEHGRARSVVASRDPQDPHHDLWWAHTGGGGGNFGVVTRYWMRTPGSVETPLPRPPATLLSGVLAWPWEGMTRQAFQALVRHHGEWHRKHSEPDSPYTALSSLFMLPGRAKRPDAMGLTLVGLVDGGLPNAQAMMSEFLDAIDPGGEAARALLPAQPWLYAMVPPVVDGEMQRIPEYDRYKGKAGYLRNPFTPAQVDTIYDYLVDPPAEIDLAGVWLNSYGGRVNAIDPAATAMAQRDSILKVVYTAAWPSPKDDEKNIDWLRRFYRDVYAETGGVPVPDGINDGSYINYPDTDLMDPEWNTSGVPWHYLYYKDNYPRLQRIKARWDPLNVFRHALSIRPATDER
ncbi:FAD-binding oxidoreductase [Streptomyces sp. NPDC059454]|jgi:FAD/FMN-containing dehydrogenase|uniref:FAD-binding oxidoreductase n=1 Tax=Streptomyces sp. NPDC059454 TaxID=3346836 RepID=UPI00368C7A4E